MQNKFSQKESVSTDLCPQNISKAIKVVSQSFHYTLQGNLSQTNKLLKVPSGNSWKCRTYLSNKVFDPKDHVHNIHILKIKIQTSGAKLSRVPTVANSIQH